MTVQSDCQPSRQALVISSFVMKWLDFSTCHPPVSVSYHCPGHSLCNFLCVVIKWWLSDWKWLLKLNLSFSQNILFKKKKRPFVSVSFNVKKRSFLFHIWLLPWWVFGNGCAAFGPGIGAKHPCPLPSWQAVARGDEAMGQCPTCAPSRASPSREQPSTVWRTLGRVTASSSCQLFFFFFMKLIRNSAWGHLAWEIHVKIRSFKNTSLII